MGQLQLIVADDRPEFHRLIDALLEGSEFNVAASVTSGQELVLMAERFAFDLMLVDVHMPSLSGLEAMRLIREMGVKSPIILMSVSATGLESQLKAGASGVVDKAELSTHLLKAMRLVMKGDKFRSPGTIG